MGKSIRYDLFTGSLPGRLCRHAQCWIQSIPNRLPREEMQKARELSWKLRSDHLREKRLEREERLKVLDEGLRFIAQVPEEALNTRLVSSRKKLLNYVYTTSKLYAAEEASKQKARARREAAEPKRAQIEAEPRTYQFAGGEYLKHETRALEMHTEMLEVADRIAKELGFKDATRLSDEIILQAGPGITQKAVDEWRDLVEQEMAAKKQPPTNLAWGKNLLRRSCPSCNRDLKGGDAILVDLSRGEVIACASCCTGAQFQIWIDSQRAKNKAASTSQSPLIWIDTLRPWNCPKCQKQLTVGDFILIDRSKPINENVLACVACATYDQLNSGIPSIARGKKEIDKTKPVPQTEEPCDAPSRELDERGYPMRRWLYLSKSDYQCQNCGTKIEHGRVFYDKSFPIGKRVRFCQGCRKPPQATRKPIQK